MSILTRAWIVCVLIAASGSGSLAAAGDDAPRVDVPATRPPAPAAALVAPTAEPADPAGDPAIKALRDEVARLRKSAAEAEAAAVDEVARLQVRVRLVEDLLLLAIGQQEQLYLQHKALLAQAEALRTSGQSGRAGSAALAPAAGGAPARTQTGALQAKGGGPVFAKRGGGGKAHRVGCVFGEKIRRETRLLYPSLAQAIAAGYQPCKVCKP